MVSTYKKNWEKNRKAYGVPTSIDNIFRIYVYGDFPKTGLFTYEEVCTLIDEQLSLNFLLNWEEDGGMLIFQ